MNCTLMLPCTKEARRGLPGSSSSAPISRLGVGIPLSGSSKQSGSHEADTSDNDLSSIVTASGSLNSKARLAEANVSPSNAKGCQTVIASEKEHVKQPYVLGYYS